MAKRKCPTCNQITVTEIGLHNDNFKRLFQWPTFQEWIILFMLIMVIVLAYAYKTETQICRDTIRDLDAKGLLDQPYIFGASAEIDIDKFNSNLSIIYDDETKAGDQTMREMQE